MTTRSALHAAALVAGMALVTSQVPSAQTPAAQAPAPAPAQARQGRGAGDTPAPARKAGEGQGPFKKMVIRGVTLIDGTGGPPLSPMDIVIEGNRITAGAPGRLAGAAAAGEPRAARRRLRDRRQGHVRDARLRRHARPRLDHRQGARPELRLQAVAGARRHHGPRRVAVVGGGQQCPRRSARRRTRSPRRASSTTRRWAPAGRTAR